MREIFLDKVTGFEIVNPLNPVVIRDTEGRIFYSTEGFAPKIKFFNLPKGVKLFVDRGNIRELKNPIQFKLFNLPRVERKFKPDPTNFDINHGFNPHKATVDWGRKDVSFDSSILSKGLPTTMFIYFHECGHRYYTTEKYADLYAVNCMLREGYNPSQIALVMLKSLSERQKARKNFIIKKLIPHGR